MIVSMYHLKGVTKGMSREQTKELCRLTRERLKMANSLLRDFLDFHHLPLLREDRGSERKDDLYLRECLEDLRHLSVYCDLGYERVSLALRRARFNEPFAERVLTEVVHTCIDRFYHPRNEVYEEEPRYIYTNRDKIRFREEPPASVKELTLRLAGIFEELRMELEAFDSDIPTRIPVRSHSATS